MRRLLSVLILALGAYLLTGVAQVRPEERAVVRRFGRVVARPAPGLWVGLPWGFDRLDRVPVRTVQLPVGFDPNNPDPGPNPPGQFLTGDQNLVNLQLVIDYAPGESAADLDDFVMHRDRAEAELTRTAEAAAGEWIAGRPVDEVLLTGNAALPAWLTTRLPDRLAATRVGVRVQRVSVGGLAAPDEVRAAFEAVNQAQTGIGTRENQARQEADQRRRQADAFRYRTEQEAEAFRRERVRLAEAEAEAFAVRLARYRELRASNPGILAAIWWDEMGRTLAGMRGRGRIDLLDAHLGRDGLDVTQFVPPKKR